MLNLERRLAKLEAPQSSADVLAAGRAPEAWTHLARWALLLHDAGGLDAAHTLPDEPNPYNRLGHLWILTHFWQRGTDAFLSETNAATALAVITYCVDDMLTNGVRRADIRSWRTGRHMWDAVQDACGTFQAARLDALERANAKP
jgi:hypothetical protein